MKQLLEYIIPNIVNHPEDVEINETTDADNVNLTIKVNSEDTGRVIGKAGKVIKAIRQIARVMAIKQGVRVNVEVLDDQSEGKMATPASETETQAQPALEEGEDAMLEETSSEESSAVEEPSTVEEETSSEEETPSDE